ncbi:transcription antitermination factor NusB [Brevibacterium samyangense]|uniref:Transcription antitermination protein NusB n=1 Tax=Brevibacterium samyangense TaxID=366888 RepID=A0ABP5EVC9_9MICO
MSSRTRARRRALEILFEAEQRGMTETELIRLRSNDPDYPMKPYAVEIVDGVVTHRDELDDLIAEHSEGWSLDRMPAVDRALLRVAGWEILHNDEVPDPVAIDEAMQLARTFSTDESPKFLGGVLSALSASRNGGPEATEGSEAQEAPADPEAPEAADRPSE